MEKLSWTGCYDGSWQGELTPEAFSHPAKASFNLAERIYRHMLAEGWLVPGMQILDPFGGVGCLAFHAALYGMRWTGVELEEKFVALAQQNLDLWRERYAPHFPARAKGSLGKEDAHRQKPFIVTLLVTNPTRQSLASSRKRVLHDHG